MPRKSPYSIVLSPGETEELRRRAAKYTLPYFQVVRAKMILLAAEGLANDAIAQCLHTRREVVSLWRNASMTSASRGWTNGHARGGPGPFPPEVVVRVKALACELPARQGAPLARWSVAELAAETRRSGLVATISDSTVWRWLHADAIRPWQHRCWIFPRDPALRRQGRAPPGSVRPAVGGPGPAGRRVCPVGRREDQHPGAGALPRDQSPAAGAADEGRARVRPGWGPGLSGRPGCPSGQTLRAVRGEDRHRPLRSAGGPGHGRAALRRGAAGLLDRG